MKIDGTAVLIGGVPFTSKGSTDGFVAKFDANGNLLFIKSIGGTGIDVAYAVAIDPIDNSIYATGSANLAVAVKVDTEDLPTGLGINTWLAKFDANGVVKWVQAVLSTTSQQKIAYDITVDNDSDPAERGVYIAGTISGATSGNTLDFGGVSLPIDANATTFPFFAKFKATNGTGGGSGVWAKVFPTGDISTANVITVNGDKDVFAGGVVKGSMDFQTTGITNITTTENAAGTVQNAGYIVKFNGGNGDVLERRILSTQGGDRVMGLVATNSALYVNGQAAGTTAQRTTANFAGTGQDFYHRPGNGGWNAFVLKQDLLIALPVSLSEFKGNKTSLGNLLSWATLSETDNDYFDLERSSDGVNFSSVKTIKGANNSTEKISYSHLDANPLPGVNYYRLKQVDKNGAYSYSENIIALNNQLGSNGIKVYPNPGSGVVNIQLAVAISGAAINVYNQAGKLVKNYSDVSGNSYTVDVSGQPAGVYFIQITGQGKSEFIKYIKQ